MTRTDFKLDDNNDLEIVNGDFVITDSDQQHVSDIFLAQKGDYKETPLIGFNATIYLKGNENNIYEFMRNLKVQLAYDGYDKAKLDASEGLGKIKISV